MIRNIVENAGIASVQSMVNCIRTIDRLGENGSGDIISFLQSLNDNKEEYNNYVDTTKAGRQIEEEIKKAGFILDPGTPLCRNNFREMEDLPGVRGCIRFLIKNEKGEYDWKYFIKKRTKMKKIIINEEEKSFVNPESVREYAISFDSFDAVEEKMIFHNKIRQDRGESWIDNWCDNDEKQKRRVHAFFMDQLRESVSKDAYTGFVKSDSFMAIVCRTTERKMKDLRICYTNGEWALDQKVRGKHKRIMFERSATLYKEFQDGAVTFDEGCFIEKGEPYLWEDDIRFRVIGTGKYYKWDVKGLITEEDSDYWTYKFDEILNPI